MRQRRWLELIKDYELEDALSRKTFCHCFTMETSDITLRQEMENLNLRMIQHGTLNELELESILYKG
jgi:hypothetical protein